jgi:hypothetical protein
VFKKSPPSGAAPKDLKDAFLAKYDGYSWDGPALVLNPWSALNAFYWGRLGDFWYQSGPPRFLDALIRKDWRVSEIFKTDSRLSAATNVVDVGAMTPLATLFQAGYLTVAEVEEGSAEPRYRPRFPNLEVEAGW